ncbi:hypothetical protein SUDANB99_01587 [Streptomyces sp. enrichment culture]
MAWYPGAARRESQPKSEGRPAIRPARLPGCVPFKVGRCGAQKSRIVTESAKSLVAGTAHQTADAVAADAGTRTTAVVVVHGEGAPVALGLLADGAHTPLARQHVRVALRRQPVQRLPLRVPSAASAVSLQPVLGGGVPVEAVGVEPKETGAALLLAPRVPVMWLDGPAVRQRGQLTPHIALPVVARAEPFADVLPRTSRELASAGLRRRAVMHAIRGRGARIPMALPSPVVHRAPTTRTHADRTAAALDSTGERVHIGIPRKWHSNQKEAP